MTIAQSSAVAGFVEAIVAQDLARACELLHPEIDFRGMTPSKVWEADGPASVEQVLRTWFEHSERDVETVKGTEPEQVADTVRVGWRVHGQRAEGPFSFEQQAYARESDGKIVWLRVMCSGPRPV